MYQIPIAVIFFNRFEETLKVFESIKKIQPRELYLISDGPRSDIQNEQEIVGKVRRIFEDIDWECNIYRNYSDDNLGCKKRVVTGLNWLFENVEESIILEDDCVGEIDFFNYAARMLAIYKNDMSVRSICGSCFGEVAPPYGHIRSDYSLMWGWATWRSRWKDYIEEPKDAYRVIFNKWRYSPLVLLYWTGIFKKLHRGDFNTWDYQWILTHWRTQTKAIRPTVNLVKNIGFGTGVHNKDSSLPISKINSHQLGRDYSFYIKDKNVIKKIKYFDENLWASIRLNTILGMYYPILIKIKKRFFK